MSDLKALISDEDDDDLLSKITIDSKISSKRNSLRVIYIVMFFTSVSYSIQMPSLWPYMNTIDKAYSKDFLGWVVAAYSIGQLITCPLFSYFAGRTGQFKLVLLFSSILAIGGNYLYSVIEDIPGSFDKKISLISSRVIIGISGANIAAIRLFLTLATEEDERIGPMATLSACQAIGFILGPGIQAALVPLGYPGVLEVSFFRINMYTASGLFSVLTSLIIFVLICIFFKEDFIFGKNEEDDKSITETLEQSTSLQVFFNDYISATFMLIAFFICMGTLAVMETSITPMTMDNFSWSKSKATLINSILLACSGICSLAVLFFIRILTRKIKERILLVIAFAFCLLSMILLIPMGTDKIPIEYTVLSKSNTTESFPIILNNGTGCNISVQPWCNYVPVLQMWKFGLALVFLTLGYPAANVLSYVIFSRLVNPSAQSLWMGLLTASGSSARIVGPIFISKLYVDFGTQVAFGSWSGIILLFMCFTPLFLLRMKRIERIKSSQSSLKHVN